MGSNSKPTYPINLAEANTLVIHCADPRFQPAFKKLVNEQLAIENYIPLVLGGSIHPYGVIGQESDQLNTIAEQIHFFVTNFPIAQIVIINHEDCKWYESKTELAPKIEPGDKCREDLQATASILSQEFPNITVRAFWAGLDGDVVSFAEET